MVLSEELLILASCLLRPMSRNQSWGSSVLEDLQSSRTKFDREHCESYLCWSRSESGGSKERAKCHLRRCDGLGNETK